MGRDSRANGYMPDKFHQDGTKQAAPTNMGGSIEKRADFAERVTQARFRLGCRSVGVASRRADTYDDRCRDSDPAATFGYAGTAPR